MAISITINNQTFNIPVAGEDPGWGEDTTSWIEAISDQVNNLGDLIYLNLTNSVMVDNQVSQTDVTGLVFDPASVRSAIINYTIVRNVMEEAGEITLVYNASNPATEKWLLGQESTGDAGISFFINDAGQLSYTSTSTGFNATLTLNAQVLLQ